MDGGEDVKLGLKKVLSLGAVVLLFSFGASLLLGIVSIKEGKNIRCGDLEAYLTKDTLVVKGGLVFPCFRYKQYSFCKIKEKERNGYGAFGYLVYDHERKVSFGAVIPTKKTKDVILSLKEICKVRKGEFFEELSACLLTNKMYACEEY